jgi:diguanylate cyclase (GGDEF)-like protein/PAS domain S-box-containing protein
MTPAGVGPIGTLSRSPLAQARLTIVVALIFALVGSLFGIIVTVMTGGGHGVEVWLIASCVLFSSVVLIRLAVTPSSRNEWLPPLACLFFLAYLTIGAVLAGFSIGITGSFFIYLLWFFFLFAFNRFVNTARRSRLVSNLIFAVPLVLASTKIAFVPRLTLEEQTNLIVFCISYSAFALVMGLFSQYREALVAERERSKGLEETARVVRQSEERFRSLVQNTSDVILIVSEGGRITYQSPAADTAWGYATDELVDQPIAALIHPGDSKAFQEISGQLLLTPRATASTEIRLRTRDGSWRFATVILTNLLHEPGVAGLVATAHDITERKAFEEQLTRQAFHDSLTGLPNRLLFRDRLDQALARAGRRHGDVGLVFLDLDNFKQINDSLGHGAGDELIREAAQRLRECVREEDTLARLGGDEFVILLDFLTEEAEAICLADRITARFGEPFRFAGKGYVVSISIGIVTRGAEDDGAEDGGAENMLRDADIAMYRAKSSGKARYVIFDPVMHTDALARLEFESELREAIGRDELVVHYQPIVELDGARISEVEALVRWQHPVRGSISPMDFIPIAEETGLIVPLGQWVLEQACRQVAAWQVRYPMIPPLTVSVNLSPRQFENRGLLDDVKRALTQSGLAPTSLKLEITESTIMRDVEATVSTMGQLKALGVHLAIDDFGTGYSSLAYLKRLPLDVLKIDRSFVSGIGLDREDRAIVKAIISLAKSLKLSVTAEGIETEEQSSLLREWACEQGQGYYFARPLNSADFATLLRKTVQRSLPNLMDKTELRPPSAAA